MNIPGKDPRTFLGVRDPLAVPGWTVVRGKVGILVRMTRLRQREHVMVKMSRHHILLGKLVHPS